jgi:hypothetical protein
MKRRLMTAAFAFGAVALLGLAAVQARAGEPAPFAPLPAGPTPAALTLGAPADAPAAPLPRAPEQPAAKPLPGAPAAPAAKVVAAPAPAYVVADGCAPACEPTCLKKVCVPESAVRTTDRRVYGEACEDFCVPKCSFFGGLSGFGRHRHDDCGACGSDGCCASGSCASCERHVRQKKYLVVRIKHDEECYTKCNVSYESPCQHGACEAPACCGGAVIAPMPPVEKVPLPKERK